MSLFSAEMPSGEYYGLALFPGVIDPSYNYNRLSVNNLKALEAEGMVFFPATGFRVNASVSFDGYEGRYWSAGFYGMFGVNDSDSFHFSKMEMQNKYAVSLDTTPHYVGCAVRLVQDVTD